MKSKKDGVIVTPSTRLVAAVVVSLLAFMAGALLAGAGCDQGNSEGGNADGRLLDIETGMPLQGASVVLAQVVDEAVCIVQANMSAVTSSDGHFEISDIDPPGEYVLLYDPSGAAAESWDEIDQLRIVFTLNEQPGGLGETPMSEEFRQSFCGNEAVTVHDMHCEYSGGGLADLDGAFSSEKYGLWMHFSDCQPASLVVEPGSTAEVEFMVCGPEAPGGQVAAEWRTSYIWLEVLLAVGFGLLGAIPLAIKLYQYVRRRRDAKTSPPATGGEQT